MITKKTSPRHKYSAHCNGFAIMASKAANITPTQATTSHHG